MATIRKIHEVKTSDGSIGKIYRLTHGPGDIEYRVVIVNPYGRAYGDGYYTDSKVDAFETMRADMARVLGQSVDAAAMAAEEATEAPSLTLASGTVITPSTALLKASPSLARFLATGDGPSPAMVRDAAIAYGSACRVWG